MAHGPALICKLLATSVSVANRAGKIIRDIMDKGNLGIISKVNIYINISIDNSYYYYYY